jgi:hypothetical protein
MNQDLLVMQKEIGVMEIYSLDLILLGYFKTVFVA